MKVMLIYPQWTGGYGIFAHFANKSSSWPPLNLAYLASTAEQQGHDVRIIDGQIERRTLSEIVEETRSFGPDLIGLTATTPFFHVAEETANALKNNIDAPIALGGHHITVLGQKTFGSVFDYGFIGEADRSWPLFLDSFEKMENMAEVKGILYREDGKIISTKKADYVRDIDSLPLPARNLLKADRYIIGTSQGKKRFTSIMTTRGCPYKCIFCSTDVFGRSVRRRSPRKVVDEMRECKENYGIDHFIILDDTLTLNKKHILEICGLIKDENLNITFEGSTRANLVDEESMSSMAHAGLIRISYGLESVDGEVRKIMKKEVPIEAYEIANKLSNKYGIETLNSCIIGMPGDTRETVRKTLAYLRKSREIKQANISIAVPYPGTELYEMAKRREHGLELLTEDFSRYRRYNSAVMKVGELSPDELLKMQNDAFASIYIAPWRWVPMLRKSGLLGATLTFSRLIKSIIGGDA